MAAPDRSCWTMAAQAGVTHVPLAYHTDNLGDDIQAAAACRWFKVSRLLDRDDAGAWPGGAVVPLVGWWNRGPALLPPRSVRFLVVGIHLQPGRRAELEGEEVRRRLKEAVRRQGFPAGCRDLTTLRLFEQAGIPACFSGCVTQTLAPYTGPRSGRLAVDTAPRPGEDWTTHQRPYLPTMTPADRLREGGGAIDRYGRLENLRTARLHAYLPAAAQGTPAVMAGCVNEPDRLAGLVEVERR